MVSERDCQRDCQRCPVITLDARLRFRSQIKYVPQPLAMGICPDEPQSFFMQQYRWCKGSCTLVTEKGFWGSGISKIHKLCFLNGLLYYIATALVCMRRLKLSCSAYSLFGIVFVLFFFFCFFLSLTFFAKSMLDPCPTGHLIRTYQDL